MNHNQPFLIGAGEPRGCQVPFEGCRHVVATGPCPECGVAPFRVRGTGIRPSADDRAWEADAHCLACQKMVGILRVEADTIFGVREDEAVLSGRCRVY
jgi:hypothetical protein